MLAGEAVVAIWNGIAPEARDAFYDWHQNEHMPERVGIPGFRRGRRYVAADAATQPEFFTLYELETLQVAQGQDYANRLNAPTPWTTIVTQQFRDTFRSLARVVDSHGPGIGGAMLTIRFDLDDPARLRWLLAEAARRARITGAHLGQADPASSALRTTETRGRDDIRPPPSWFILIEATGVAALANILPDQAMAAAGAHGMVRGTYVLELVRGRTAWQ
jgi:hypothetical protein